MTFLESDLKFDFNPTLWRVMKYDAHHYFRTLSGAGLKGVDFIGIHQAKKLVFFEVKHFRTPISKTNTSIVLFEDTDLFVQNIGAKMEDTVTAIKVIIKYLTRKAWYRYFLKFEKYIPSSIFHKQDWYFWHQIHHLWTSNASKSFVLWLEIDPQFSIEANSDFRKDLQKRLEIAFDNFDIRPTIANRKKPVFRKSLDVKKGT